MDDWWFRQLSHNCFLQKAKPCVIYTHLNVKYKSLQAGENTAARFRLVCDDCDGIAQNLYDYTCLNLKLNLHKYIPIYCLSFPNKIIYWKCVNCDMRIVNGAYGKIYYRLGQNKQVNPEFLCIDKS